MAPETHSTATPPAPAPVKPLVFQTPPVLTTEITAEEQGAIQHAPLSYAKRISNQAALLSGAIGGLLGSLALIPAAQASRAAKIIASTLGGGLVGYLISNLPWNQKQQPTPPKELELPSVPTLPTSSPKPDPAPATPAVSIARSEHDGRVEDTMPVQGRTA